MDMKHACMQWWFSLFFHNSANQEVLRSWLTFDNHLKLFQHPLIKINLGVKWVRLSRMHKKMQASRTRRWRTCCRWIRILNGSTSLDCGAATGVCWRQWLYQSLRNLFIAWWMALDCSIVRSSGTIMGRCVYIDTAPTETVGFYEAAERRLCYMVWKGDFWRRKYRPLSQP